MKLLVTGGAGFIGARIVTLLLEAGHVVAVFDNLSTGRRTAVPAGAQLVEGDLRDVAAIRAAVGGRDAVIHLAAQALVPESVAEPQKAFDINLAGGQNLLEAMRAAGVTRLVYSSTAAVYGTPAKVPIAEDDPKLPINPYGATKYAFEQLLHAYHAAYGFNVVMFRYFNPYGPTEAHDPETHAVPNFIRATLTGQPIPLYWNGDQIRDFFYVDDIARAHVMGLGRDGFEIYNLGSGSGAKVRDVVQKIFDLTGRTTTINDLGERPGDPPQLLADITKARRQLGWQPQISLDDGLARTIAAFRERTH
ncbi:MAG TPA: NAD-dependent epimerase/dehydratase family protein [Candidatus Saccharimonadia bacterium]|nr:NAD-dependent epimerase/dehydratase family protein [Candidatus Saccharimonadia bacterium]